METALVRDVVVVVPGIMGSELVGADGRPLWSVSPGGLVRAIRSFAAGRLTLPAGIGDEAPPKDGVRASRLLDSLHVVPGLWSPITGYDGLMDFLRSPRFHLIEAEAGDTDTIPNLIAFPYDWRLSNRHNGRLLAKVALDVLERWREQPGMRDAKLVLICHSMGGLVARWFAEREGGAEAIRALVTIGTPHRGALKALTALVNGLEPKFGPLHLSLTAFARSLPSLHQLLPQYDCLVGDGDGDGQARSSIAAGGARGIDSTMFADAAAFHEAILPTGPSPYVLHKIVGIRQPTPTTARWVGGRVVPAFDIDGLDQGGDGTVPRMAAELLEGRGREVHEIANQHGELQQARSLLDLVDGILTRDAIVWQSARSGNDARDGFGVEMDELWSSREAPALQVTGVGDRRLRVSLLDEAGRPVGPPRPLGRDDTLSFGPLPESGYKALVDAPHGGPPPVLKGFVVLAPE